MFLKDISIISIAPCSADPGKVQVIAQLSTDITGVMPYLKAVLKNATYNRNVSSLTFMKEFRLITLYPRHLTMTKALNTTDALQVLNWLKNLINDVYERRESIIPSRF